ncbi:MAG: hypothetical protein ACJ79S_19240, partial [Gemmatimonadaceae bacterium]
PGAPRAPGAPGDSAAGGPPAAPAAPSVEAPAPSSVPGQRIESPRAVFGTAPCGVACVVGGGAGAGGGVDAPLGEAQRDSIRRAVARRAQEGAAGGGGAPIQDPAAAAANGQPERQSGVTLGTGLPGGGPSNAQRRRDRVINADVSARLARIKARADSVEAARRDSLRRQ